MTTTDFRYEQVLVRALLRDQHPDLAELELVDIDGGWDNQQWRLGPDLGVRLPRTERGPELLRKEQRWLPQLAGRLPLPVPEPVRIGQPSARFDKPWSITKWVEGEPADRRPITHPDSASRLAGFLTALHRPSPPDAPTSRDRGIPLQKAENDAFGLIADHPQLHAIRKIWRDAFAAPIWSGDPSWLHGDLHPANVVVTDGKLTGVLDFGDLCAGDPATDLSAAWILLPDGSEQAFFDAYDTADGATIARARGWAILKAIGLIYVGRNGRLGLPGGKPTWEPAGYATLERLTQS